MDPPVTPPMPDHILGHEILTKHKEAIRQLYKRAKFMPVHLAFMYSVGESTINRVLRYDQVERVRPNRKGAPHLLNDPQVNFIIEYLSETYRQRTLNWSNLHDELKLTCTPRTLERRLKQRGYFRCVACQKPYLNPDQVHNRFIWGIAHIFWHLEWRKVLWSDEVTFLIRGRTAKEKVTRKRGERDCLTCIQHQLHRGNTTPVNAWGGIGYGYKTPLLFLKGTGKSGAFKQTDYLSQILTPHIQGFLEDFASTTHKLNPAVEPLFMEDGNSAHGHKSTTNCCARWRTAHGIILMPHPSTSPDMNPIEKCWRRIKQALHRRRHQPTNEAEMQAAVTEEWDKIPQEWINSLIDKQEHWVNVLVERHGWATPN
jgi:transposase